MREPISIFGAALFGMSFDDAETVAHVLDQLKLVGVKQIDTAPRYPPLSPGKSEELLGEAHAASRGFAMDSKVLAKPGSGGELEPASIKESISKTLARLGSQQLDTFYCHKFDVGTPLEEQTSGLDACYRQGLFKKLGVVGFQPDQLQAFLDTASANGRVKPSVYQGEYNIITRGMEQKLLPLLRTHNIAYYAHCPLAAGFLTGNFTKGNQAGTRFADNHPLHHVFLQRYDVPALHEAIRKLEEAGAPYIMSVRDISLRWIFYHSVLGQEDGVITGCTTLAQITQNAQSLARGPLPDELVGKVDAIWDSLVEGRAELL